MSYEFQSMPTIWLDLDNDKGNHSLAVHEFPTKRNLILMFPIRHLVSAVPAFQRI